MRRGFSLTASFVHWLILVLIENQKLWKLHYMNYRLNHLSVALKWVGLRAVKSVQRLNPMVNSE